ncbi:preprotein translocase subunit SecG [Roseicyclus persicicus]|uniref:Protein-export membrane protein SecG n=1 Tax=Roseicyclus persicicus TaxID=2650661 RepID=A0A7X6GWE9_9RHOB|nr:preprotein translocase subunit SecG [Roseibacterium persicicum]NKX43656.1 preprotein translocase subunit SecG [Roseibacterium persicicum]
MENVILVVHLILAICLIGVVLLQRSEGGGLGMGGGGGVMTGRQAATALGKLTWAFAIAFLATSITLTILAAQNSAGSSVLDRIGTGAPTDEAPATDGPALPPASDLLPPITGDSPVLPPRAD